MFVSHRSWHGETGEDKVDVMFLGADVIDPIHMEVNTGGLYGHNTHMKYW